MAILLRPNSEAFNFLDAAGIARTQANAPIIIGICQLTTDLKNYGLWNKMKAIYPMVGQAGVSSSFQFNLKDPRDTNSAFRLTFSGSWTYSSLGVQGDGTSSYVDTYLIPDLHLINNNTYITTYTTTTTETGATPIGVFSGSQPAHYLIKQLAAGTKEFFVYNYTSNRVTQGGNTGFFGAGRTSLATIVTQFNNTVITSSFSNTYSTISPYSFYLGAYNNGGPPAGNTSARIAFSSIGYGLTTTEAANLYTAVQRFQTTLGRQV